MVLNLFLDIFFYRGFFAPFEKHNPTGFISVLFLLLQLSPARQGKINWKQKSENAGKYGWYGQNVSLLKVGVKRAGGVIAGGNNFSAQFRFSVFVLMGLSRWAHQRCKKRGVDGVGGELIIKMCVHARVFHWVSVFAQVCEIERKKSNRRGPKTKIAAVEQSFTSFHEWLVTPTHHMSALYWIIMEDVLQGGLLSSHPIILLFRDHWDISSVYIHIKKISVLIYITS